MKWTTNLGPLGCLSILLMPNVAKKPKQEVTWAKRGVGSYLVKGAL